jgi:hypothetical protein
VIASAIAPIVLLPPNVAVALLGASNPIGFIVFGGAMLFMFASLEVKSTVPSYVKPHRFISFVGRFEIVYQKENEMKYKEISGGQRLSLSAESFTFRNIGSQNWITVPIGYVHHNNEVCITKIKDGELIIKDRYTQKAAKCMDLVERPFEEWSEAIKMKRSDFKDRVLNNAAGPDSSCDCRGVLLKNN